MKTYRGYSKDFSWIYLILLSSLVLCQKKAHLLVFVTYR